MRPPIERVTSADLTMRAISARGRVPQHLGAVLVLDECDPGATARLLAERAALVPGLRRRLEPVPPGCGRPIWVDDGSFDARRHVRRVACPEPGDEGALLDLAIDIVLRPLASDLPLWSATVVTGLTDSAVAVVIVADHVLTDGIGGLAVLARLLDGAGPVDDVPGFATAHPAQPPGRPPLRALIADAWRDRWQAVRGLPGHVRQLGAAAGGGEAAKLTAARRCSLLRPTGPRREVRVVRADVATLKAAAHRYGGTLNDAILTQVAGALHQLLARRGERVEEMCVVIPAALSRTEHLGNLVNPVLVTVPGAGEPARRLVRTVTAMSAARAVASRPSLIAQLGPAFRLLARLGVHRWWMAHQRFMHTLVTNVHGPDEAMFLGGVRIREMIAIPVSENGNMPVTFAVLSYAGTAMISVIADPEALPDLPQLMEELREQVTVVCSRD
ncbi:wax ester/triacylglycerol synthase domain-containing protein [Nonomuraea soli]|uniref:diacylglycerol O-acyltransferase n=1 Tax=Nonomuraea soli TaxID=1032476 RepID=A0A7W0HNQ0_9ACTN|nr:wax ester/triacylglycerol synthase domain-containing protein [Nonomuraea soli]MBA2890049.1 WS/DGAT/MGAT family acyltransferase [Nonomuraea soli]